VAKKTEAKRNLVTFCDGAAKAEGNLTAADIASAYKASLLDFVRGEASRHSVATVSTLLKGALDSRKQELMELEDSPAKGVNQYF
jgi:hypothetical protein